MDKPVLLVSDVARRLKVTPRVISDLLYQRRLDDGRCPIVGGCRIIPVDYLPEIEAVLREISKCKKNREKASK